MTNTIIPVEKLRKNGKNLIDQKFGRLKVIKLLGKSIEQKCLFWLCKCDCGTERGFASVNLLRGTTKSCGCLQKEIVSSLMRGKKPISTLPSGVAAFNFIFSTYKRDAKEHNREFSLTEQEFKKLILGNCSYCNIPPSREVKNGHNSQNGTFKANGIDRVDSNKGYIIGNVVSCCRTCNVAKNDLSKSDFFLWTEKVSEFVKTKEMYPLINTIDFSNIWE